HREVRTTRRKRNLSAESSNQRIVTGLIGDRLRGRLIKIIRVSSENAIRSRHDLPFSKAERQTRESASRAEDAFELGNGRVRIQRSSRTCTRVEERLISFLFLLLDPSAGSATPLNADPT